MRHGTSVVVIVAAVLIMGQSISAQDSAATFDVRGDVRKPRQWAISHLKQEFSKEIQTVRFSTGMDQEQHTGTGIPLVSLLQAAEPRTEKNPKHYELSFFVILEARDNYRVYFSLAELLSSCGRTQAWLILDMDGKALPAKEAPIRLAVLSDQGHDRYLYGITGMTLVDGTKLAARLSAGNQ
jgi:DMSO/TMAO reductase YedYZ molybdopterin-dependent catalytic subunit